VTIQTSDGEEMLVEKHDIKFYFDVRRRKQVMKQVSWGSSEDRVEPGILRTMSNRGYVKARVYLMAQEDDRTIRWESLEGDGIKGKVLWFGRFEVVLETGKGDRVVTLRHAIRSAS